MTDPQDDTITDKTIVQIAIDLTETEAALELAGDALLAGADWLEVGNPWIKLEGGRRTLQALRSAYPDAYVLADLMILSGSKRYIDLAAEAGINNVTVTALAPDYTVEEAIVLGRDRGVDVTVDLFNVDDPVAGALKYEAMGATHVMVHFGVDQKRKFPAGSPVGVLRDVVDAVSIPVSYATYGVEEAVEAVRSGAAIIVQGSPLITGPDRLARLTEFVRTVHTIPSSRS